MRSVVKKGEARYEFHSYLSKAKNRSYARIESLTCFRYLKGRELIADENK